jgi:hypothetical protein
LDVSSGSSSRSLGLVARKSGAGEGSWYLGMVRYSGGTLTAEVWRSVNGQYTRLGFANISGSTGNARFEVIGTSLRFFWNDVLVISGSDSQLTSGSVGVRSNYSSGLAVDNFVVAAPGNVTASATHAAAVDQALAAMYANQTNDDDDSDAADSAPWWMW